MGRWTPLGVATALVGGALAIAAAPPAPATVVEPCVEQTSWTAGATEVCAGELVYRDYVYDDHGAGPNRALNSSMGPLASGGATYPSGTENTADLVTLRLRIADDRLVVDAELNTLFEPDSTVVAVAIDTDNDASTGGGTWPGLGVSSAGWDEVSTFVTGDPATNVVSGSIDVPAGSTWRVQAVTARAGGPVMNVAFRGVDETGPWWEDRQAAALQSGDISAFGAVVDVDDLRTGATVPPVIPASGVFERVYTSDVTVPPQREGVSTSGVQGRWRFQGGAGGSPQLFHYLGRHQPYGIYVPPATGADHGVQLVLHGAGDNHSTFLSAPGMREQLADPFDRILVMPLGRGPNGSYADYSERDVLDVLADVEATYPTDPDRVFVSGYSMGGYGSIYLAGMYPHRFAGIINWVGGPICSRSASGEPNCPLQPTVLPNDVLENLDHVPSAHVYGMLDELNGPRAPIALDQALVAANVPYILYNHPTAEHFTFAVLDDWRKEAAYTAGRVRETHPSRVRWRNTTESELADAGTVHDRAHWLHDIEAASPGWHRVDLTSEACGTHGEPTITRNDTVDRPTGTEPMPWYATFAEVARTAAEPASRLTGWVQNIGALTVDLGGACLGTGAIDYELTTDGPVTIQLSDGRGVHLPAAGTHTGTVIDETVPPPPTTTTTTSPPPDPPTIAPGPPRCVAVTGSPCTFTPVSTTGSAVRGYVNGSPTGFTIANVAEPRACALTPPAGDTGTVTSVTNSDGSVTQTYSNRGSTSNIGNTFTFTAGCSYLVTVVGAGSVLAGEI